MDESNQASSTHGQNFKNSMENVSSIDLDLVDWPMAFKETFLAYGLDKFLLSFESVLPLIFSTILLVNTHDYGMLFVTNFRLLFVSNTSRQLIPLGTIPLAMIEDSMEHEAKVTHKTAYRRILVYGFLQTKVRRLVKDELTRSMTTLRLPDLYALTGEPSMVKN